MIHNTIYMRFIIFIVIFFIARKFLKLNLLLSLGAVGLYAFIKYIYKNRAKPILIDE